MLDLGFVCNIDYVGATRIEIKLFKIFFTTDPTIQNFHL